MYVVNYYLSISHYISTSIWLYPHEPIYVCLGSSRFFKLPSFSAPKSPFFEMGHSLVITHDLLEHLPFRQDFPVGFPSSPCCADRLLSKSPKPHSRTTRSWFFNTAGNTKSMDNAPTKLQKDDLFLKEMRRCQPCLAKSVEENNIN